MGALDAVSFVVKGGSPRPLGETIRLRTPAWITLFAAVALASVGLSAIDVALRPVVEPGEPAPSILTRQLIFLAIGSGLGLLVVIPHYRFWAHWALAGFLCWLGLLVFLLVPAVPDSIVSRQRGARAWIDLGPVDLQPSEFMKIAFVLLVAAYLRFRTQQRSFAGIFLVGLIAMAPISLITLQPDLGTAMLFVPSLLAMLIASGARLRHLAIIVCCAALAAPMTYPLLKPHQKARIVGMIRQVQGDRSTAHDLNFQSFTAQTLAGAGGAAGQPDAQSRVQVHYNQLPEGHNDMIYAVIVNRWGMLGGLGVMMLYVLWVMGALWTAAMCRSPFGRLVAVGIAAFIASQAVLNIGMNIGIMPIVGITLPFVSYGGASMLACCIMTGFILAIGLHKSDTPGRPAFEFLDDE